MGQRIYKTVKEYVIQSHYPTGWEDVDASETYKEARVNLKLYRENEPHLAHRLITRREPNPAYSVK